MHRTSRLSALAVFTLLAGCGASQNAAGTTGPLAVGTVAPAFRALDQAGAERTSEEFAGHPIVLYFYPRDATPGCTTEACAFRDAWDRLQATGAIVLGVSTDGVDAHRAFAAEHHLPFPLLADTTGAITASYGVGVRMGMANRVTFVIGRDGRIAHVFPDVDPGVHANEVLDVLAALPQ